jgi:hypothetical protein
MVVSRVGLRLAAAGCSLQRLCNKLQALVPAQQLPLDSPWAPPAPRATTVRGGVAVIEKR